MRSILTLLLFIALATPAFAADGVLEINQTCAVQTGCFSGDTANNNGNDGISAGSGSSVHANTAYGNGTSGAGYGLALSGLGGAYRENVVRTNALITATRGTVLGGINAGGNVCNGSLTCP